MEKSLYTQLDDWLKLCISKKKIYMKIAEHEINGSMKSDDYKNLIEILFYIDRFEKKAIDNIDFNKRNIEEIKKYMSKNMDLVNIENFQQDTYIETYRIANILSQIENSLSETDNSSLTIFDLIKKMNQEEKNKDKEYSEIFQNVIIRNTIKLIDISLDDITDIELKTFLIKYKYSLIYITPEYEKTYLICNRWIQPFVDIDAYKNQITGYDKETFKSLNYFNINNLVLNIVIELIKVFNENYDIKKVKIHVYKLIFTLEAYLISIHDTDFLLEMKESIEQLLIDNKTKSYIDESFQKSLEILHNILENKKKLMKKCEE